MKTDEELKEIAIGIRKGEIFTDRHLKGNVSLLGIVFMPLIFMTEEQEKMLENVGMVYEYMNQAGPRGINGYPSFMSMKMLSQGETNKVVEYWKKLEEAEKSVV